MFGNNNLVLLAGNSNRTLAEAIAASLKRKLCHAKVTKFSDGETWVEVEDNVRGADVFVIQSTSHPANDHIMELLVMIDALKRASAGRITAVIPYYGYARQDRKVSPRTPISSKLVADLITAAGAERVLTMELHAGQIQGFFNIPVDHLFAKPVLLDYLKGRFPADHLAIVAPDAGGAERARSFAKHLHSPMVMIDKRRVRPNESEVMHLIGDVDGRDAVIVDDMIDTGGTMVEAAEALIRNGAKSVFACCTHPVLSGPAISRINDSKIEELIVTDTVPLGDKAERCRKIRVLSVAGLLGEAIKRIHDADSVSSLFV
ncbi:MAG: ribose-phosphate pyrophosphokinase [Proteobacteria bacterium]|nr:ribose-phosphate pyrophosphokinase [Pseudomonadota bacterium]